MVMPFALLMFTLMSRIFFFLAMAVKVASIRRVQWLFEPSLTMLRTVQLQKGYDRSVFQKLRQNCTYSILVVREVSTCDDPSLSPTHRCEHSEEVVESACVFAFDSEYLPAPTAKDDVKNVQAMSQSGSPKNGKSFDVFKARRDFARQVRGQGFSEDARLRIPVATAVKISPRTKIQLDDSKTFYENDPVYALVIQTLEEGSNGSGYVIADGKIRHHGVICVVHAQFDKVYFTTLDCALCSCARWAKVAEKGQCDQATTDARGSQGVPTPWIPNSLQCQGGRLGR